MCPTNFVLHNLVLSPAMAKPLGGGGGHRNARRPCVRVSMCPSQSLLAR